MSYFGGAVAFNSTFALSNTLTDIYENNVNDWKYGSNTAWWASNSLSNYIKAPDQIYGSNTASWTSNQLPSYALSNGQSNWNWASNLSRFLSNALDNYALVKYQSNWFYASNTASWTSNHVVHNQSNWNYASNTATWASNEVGSSMSNIDYGSNTAKWASNTLIARSSNWDYASNTARWASNEVGIRDSNWDYGSNTARWASNEVGTRDSNWDYGSNTARWASNAIFARDSNLDYGSNTAKWASNTLMARSSNWDYASNTARWASNEVGTRDSNWDYGSNTARWASNEIGTRDSNWDYGSNTARWVSNFAVSLSNDQINWMLVNVDPPPGPAGNAVGTYGSMVYNLMNSNVSYIDYTGRSKLITNNLYLSNATRWASNEVGIRASNWEFGSNTARWASNEVGFRASNWDYGSNTAQWASNSARWASNEVGMKGSNWDYASNTARWASNRADLAYLGAVQALNGKVKWSNITGPPTNLGAAANNLMLFDTTTSDVYFQDYETVLRKVSSTSSTGSSGSTYWLMSGGTMQTSSNVYITSSSLSIGSSLTNYSPLKFYGSTSYASGYEAHADLYAAEIYADPNNKTTAGQFGLIVNTFPGQFSGASTTAPGGLSASVRQPAFTTYPDYNGQFVIWPDETIGMTDGVYRFRLGVDSATKPGSGLWAVTSDERVKENIVLADLDKCYDNIKKIPLKHFKWSYEQFSDGQIYDRRKLGWIAQDVEKVFKKAVRTNPHHPTIPNCRSLDADQIYACMYGTIQKLQEMCEKMQARIDVLEAKI